MKIIQIDLNKDYSDAILEAVRVLNYGGVIIYPTDTVYGIGGNALDEKSVQRVFDIKQRPLSKPLPIIARNLIWVEGLAYISPRNRKALEKLWPGKITTILPKREIVPNITTSGNNSVGVRIPDHVFLDELLGKFGYPLVGSSANISGDEPSGNIDKIISDFSKSVLKPDLILDVGHLEASEPSTILDLSSDKPKVLRVGPSRPEQLLKLLEIS